MMLLARFSLLLCGLLSCLVMVGCGAPAEGSVSVHWLDDDGSAQGWAWVDEEVLMRMEIEVVGDAQVVSGQWRVLEKPSVGTVLVTDPWNATTELRCTAPGRYVVTYEVVYRLGHREVQTSMVIELFVEPYQIAQFNLRAPPVYG